jgi:hypothetical protein
MNQLEEGEIEEIEIDEIGEIGELGEEEEMEEEMEEKEEQQKPYAITIELGDIIQIFSPQNLNIHENTIYVTYIDDSKLRGTNIATYEVIQLNIENQRFTDETIRQIDILSRSETPGYARQNGLIQGVWVDIYFGMNIPTVITGEITNLDEDQIEITTIPQLDAIYIDFEYKGLPEHIPIREIVIRQKPDKFNRVNLLKLRNEIEDGEEFDIEEFLNREPDEPDEPGDIIKLGETLDPQDNIRDILQTVLRKSSGIIYGKRLDAVVQIVEVSEEYKRFHIDEQINSLLDEYLSTIPNHMRTKSYMNKIHILIERFRELRTKFSLFDENADIESLKIKGPAYKPLLDPLYQLQTAPKWLLPTVGLRKKLYFTSEKDIEDTTEDTAEYTMQNTLLQEEDTKNKAYYANFSKIDEVKYTSMYRQTRDFHTPFLAPPRNKTFLCDKNVNTNIEAVVNNDDSFSTAIHIGRINRIKHAVQTYNLGLSHIKPHMEKGNNIYMTEPMTPADNIHIKSFIMMPLSILDYSRIHLPSTNIMDKSNLSRNDYLLFPRLKKTRVPYFIKDLTKEIDYNDNLFNSNIKEYILSDEVGLGDKQKFHKFLDVILPKTSVILNQIIKNMSYKTSFQSIVKLLEPFGIYSEDITFSKYYSGIDDKKLSSYGEIRTHIENQIKRIRATYKTKTLLFEKFGDNTKTAMNMLSIIKTLFEKKENLDLMLTSYKLPAKEEIAKYMTGPEVLAFIMNKDHGMLYSLMLSSLMSTLYMPNNLYGQVKGAFGAQDLDMSDIEKIKPTDCARKVLSKKYTSIGQLQKDNGTIEVYYDKEYDDTPYDLLNKYKEQKKKMLPEEFPEFLTENLIQKHDCPIEIAPELTTTLIAGKRGVKEGEYAVLELKPQLPNNMGDIDEKTKEKIEIEGEVRVKYQYYRRVKDHWVQERDIDENAFLDNNALFCNIQPDCIKVELGCISTESAAEHVKRVASMRARDEFSNRIEISMKDIEQNILSDIQKHLRRMVRLNVLSTIQTEKYDYLANALGNLSYKSDVILSPYARLRDLILGQTDFTKKQSEIVTFVQNFTREAMMEQLGENLAWKYCQVTNTPLMPTFLYDLAYAFISGQDYRRLLDEICANIGVLSEDGDSVVDKHTGYVIRKIDFSTEEGFSEEGYRITTHSIMEKDLGTVVLENLGKRVAREFEDETSKLIYTIFTFLSANIGLPTEAIFDFVHSIASEIIHNTIKSEDIYNRQIEKMAKQAEAANKKFKAATYSKYKNENIIHIVTGTTLVAIQTAMPTFFTKKTYPGCVRSFDGYPFTGVENTRGIQYMACILEKSRASIEPWDSLKSMKQDVLAKRIKDTIENFVFKHPKVDEAYVLKRQYLEQNPDIEIEKEHAVEKWRTFMPPLVNIQIAKSIMGVGEGFYEELIAEIKEGKRQQNKKEMVLKSKIIHFTAAIIEAIQAIVHNKELFLKTSGNVPFLQNACCNEKDKSIIPIYYFIEEDDKIKSYIKYAAKCRDMSYKIRILSKAPLFSYETPFRQTRSIANIGIMEENLYDTIIHYLGLDRGFTIPIEFHGILQEVVDGYNPTWSIVDKIAFLKRSGKRFDENQFYQVMSIVERRNIVKVYNAPNYSPIEALREFLSRFESASSDAPAIIEKGLAKNILAKLKDYQPKVVYNTRDKKEDRDLRSYLINANTQMHRDIMAFFATHGKLSKKHLSEVDTFLRDITVFNIQDAGLHKIDMALFQTAKFLKNAVYDITRVLPNIILNDVDINSIPKYWGLSDNDEAELEKFIGSYIKPLNNFRTDNVIHDIIRGIQLKLADLNIFIQHIPLRNPMVKDGSLYYSLFDKEQIYYLLTYTFYSVLYEYITVTENDNYMKRDVIHAKQERRQKIRESRDPAIFSVEGDEIENLYDTMDEVQIEEGNQMDLKERVAQVLLGYLSIIEGNKGYANYSYEMIDKKVKKSREREKKMITDRFKTIAVDERKVENMMKQYKLGKWNVGQQKGLVVYDKTTSDRERMEKNAREENDIEFDLIHQGMEEEGEGGAMEDDDIEPQVRFEEDYADQTDIRGMHQDYNDGVFYEDDATEDFADD